MRGAFSLRKTLTRKSLCTLIFLISTVSGQEDYSKWTYHQKIYINTTNLSLSTDISNFPLLIRVTPASMDGYSNVNAKGADIRFSKPDNSTPLSYEIENWDGTSGVLWVNVDTVFKNNSSQYIVMHYGSTGAADSSIGSKVFQTSNKFAGVWHMNETPVTGTACIKDRTSNSHDGTPSGTIDASNMRSISGMTGSAIMFNGTNNFINLATPSTLVFGKSNISVSTWINTSSSNSQGIVVKSNNGNHVPGDKSLGVIDKTNFGVDHGWVTGCYGTSNVANGKWHYLAWTQKAADSAGRERWILYVDGVKEKSILVATGNDVDTHTVQIGQLLAGDKPYFTNRFNGKIDEVVISDTTRSPDWINLCYQTQRTDQATVCFKPKIVLQPHDTLVNIGDTAAFFIEARGDSLTYKWQKSLDGTTWKDTGSTGSSYKFKTALTTDTNTRYRCIVSSSSYSDTSTSAVVKLLPCIPARIATQPDDKVVIEGKAAQFTARGTGSSISYQWQRKSGTTWNSIPGAIDTVCYITANVTDNGAIFRCLVIGLCGTDSSQEVTLTVYSKVHASFNVSDSIGPAPLSVTFDDSSSGSISKWRWYFGDGKSIECSTSTKQVHVFDSAKTYQVKLVVEGPGGVDSTLRTIKVYLRGGNPIVLTGRYIASNNVELQLKNYGSLQTASPPPFVSAVNLWIQNGALPLDTAGSKLQKTYNLSSLKARGSDYFDTIKVVPLSPPDSTYGFATQVVWNDGTTTPFTTTNGFLVLMRDTVKPVNDLRLSAAYAPKDTVTFYLDSIQKIDTVKVDSVGLWYGLGSDTVPNFESNTAAIKWWSAREIVTGASSNRFKYQLKNDQFNTTSKTLTCAVVLVNKSHIRGATVKTNIGIGLPLNPIHLHATAISSSSVRLTWNLLTEQDSIERIRIYFSNRDTLPYNCEFSAIKVDSVVPEPMVMDTTILVSNLNEKTRYHFGARVYKKGLWSTLTNVSVANDSTMETSTLTNTVILSELVYDTAPHNVRIFWHDTLLDSSFQLGVTFSFTQGITPSDTGFEKIVNILSDSDSVVVALDSSIPLDQDLDVFLWLRKNGGPWSAPTPQSTGKIHIPPFTFREVHYNFNSKGDTTSWINGQIRLITPPVGPNGVGSYTSIIRTFKIDTSKAPGLVAVGSSFVFSEKTVSPAFSIYLKCINIPPKYSLRDVRIYRFDGNRWIVERNTKPGTDSLSVFVNTYSLDMPFAAMIDTLPPEIKVLSHTKKIVEKGVTVFDTVYVSDNTGNVVWNYRCSKGEHPFPSGAQSQTKTLSTGSDTAIIYIQKELIVEDNGVRAQLFADDGRSTVMVDLSRQVIREKSDLTVTETMKWTPLRVTANLDTPSAGRLFNFVNPPNAQTASYDNHLIRLFRWYPYASNAGSPDKWVEYSNVPDSVFEFRSGRLLWVKTRNSIIFDFGKAATMSLTDTVEIPLNKKEWTDFASPFMFNIRVGDIISATRKTSNFTDSLQIYKWIKDSSGTYHCDPFFIATRSDNGLDSLPKVMSYFDAGFSVYNPCDAPITLRVPPIPEALSPTAGYVAKRAATKGWVVRVIPRGENGTELSSVYCGYTPAFTGAQYYPLPPRFEGPEVGVVEEQSGQLLGSEIFHEVKNGGCTYLLSLRNKDKSGQTMRLELARWGNLPSEMKTMFYNPLNGQMTNVSGKEALALKVEGQTQEYVLLLVGDDNYIASGVKKFFDVKLALNNVYPNPLRGAMHLEYMVPFARVGEVKFKILDLMGKTVWQTTIKERTVLGGVRSVTWNGTTKAGTYITSGFYFINMTAYDFNSRAIGSFNRKITVLR